jgi:ABC-type hemin transport system substrate-binding protein
MDAGCLNLAADAAETIGADNSIEKMLSHQLAAAHVSTMRMFASAEDEMNRSRQQGGHERRETQLSATRLNNSAARMMTSFQQGMTALHRVRHGGKQIVTVQHVHVSDGGQAVVAGKVHNAGRGRKRRGNANK